MPLSATQWVLPLGPGLASPWAHPWEKSKVGLMVLPSEMPLVLRWVQTRRIS